MCHPSVIEWVRNTLRASDVEGKWVLEVGAYDENGSVRSVVEALGPKSYVGTDIRPGPGVDHVQDVTKLASAGIYDLVIATELLEHVQNWNLAVYKIKAAVRLGGIVVVTTRSPGFPRHDFPDDHWRFTESTLAGAFADFRIERLDEDPEAPGLFLLARRSGPVVCFALEAMRAPDA